MQRKPQLTLSVSERPLGLGILLDQVVHNVTSGEDSSRNQDLHIAAFTDADCDRQVSKAVGRENNSENNFCQLLYP